MIVTKAIKLALLVFKGVGEILKIEAVQDHLFPAQGFHVGAVRNIRFQQTAVFPEGIIYIPNQVVLVAFQLVVIIVPTIIVAELFIRPAAKQLSAGQACFSGVGIHNERGLPTHSNIR